MPRRLPTPARPDRAAFSMDRRFTWKTAGLAAIAPASHHDNAAVLC
jgi:hypothetical protein